MLPTLRRMTYCVVNIRKLPVGIQESDVRSILFRTVNMLRLPLQWNAFTETS